MNIYIYRYLLKLHTPIFYEYVKVTQSCPAFCDPME